jgi:hypothetical protein
VDDEVDDDVTLTPPVSDDGDTQDDGDAPGDVNQGGSLGMDDGQSGSSDDASPSEPTTPEKPVQTANTLHTEGRYLLDTCGKRFVVRGVEQVFGLGIGDVNGSFDNLVDEIAKSGANAVRVLPNLEQLGVPELDAIFKRITGHGMVIFLSPGDRNWFAQADVQTLLDKYKGSLIVDAFQEPNYDDRTRWQSDAISAVQAVRDMGYTVPVTVLANQYGRDLPALLQNGANVVSADPLENTILGWQAYWGNTGWYQANYGMSLAEAVQTIGKQSFPIQAGIDGFADPGDAMDYVSTMQQSQTDNVGWLWWDWYNPFGPSNNLTADGSAANLTTLGKSVVTEDENGLRSAQKACTPAGG